MDPSNNKTTDIPHHGSVMRNFIFSLIDSLTTDDIYMVCEYRFKSDAFTSQPGNNDTCSLDDLLDINLQAISDCIFDYTTKALAVRANEASCPDVLLDRTILFLRGTMDRFPYPFYIRYYSLGYLATALQIRFNRSRNQADMDEYIQITSHICDLDPSVRVSFYNLGLMLCKKLQLKMGNENDLLPDTIRVLRKTLELTPESASDRLECLRNLRVSLDAAFNIFS
ncbi:hypothetical protein BDQ17DRAFT_1364034, partial [Cyathus striatus]